MFQPCKALLNDTHNEDHHFIDMDSIQRDGYRAKGPSKGSGDPEPFNSDRNDTTAQHQFAR